ncbi:MAG TPA: ribbon-helix-helix protein, CopG family [Bacillota bacterium]|nr:ribbon-helix-helix protein, CopG family [Bacillota bacterium]
MAQAKRIVVSLPESLLQEVDGIVRRETGNRSEFIREAVRRLIADRQRLGNIERYRVGYETVGKLNLVLAEDGLAADSCDLENYENYLVKRDK